MLVEIAAVVEAALMALLFVLTRKIMFSSEIQRTQDTCILRSIFSVTSSIFQHLIRPRELALTDWTRTEGRTDRNSSQSNCTYAKIFNTTVNNILRPPTGSRSNRNRARGSACQSRGDQISTSPVGKGVMRDRRSITQNFPKSMQSSVLRYQH